MSMALLLLSIIRHEQGFGSGLLRRQLREVVLIMDVLQ
jgi:hypothetical protein